jgi:hypothetical protein
MLRNPAEVVYSTYLKTLEYGVTDITFESAINENPDYLKLGYYHRFLKPYYEIFPSTNIHIIIYEKFFSNLEQELESLLRFLGIAHKFRPSVINERVNPRRTVRWKFVVKFRHHLRLIMNSPPLIPLKRLLTNGNFFNNLSELIIKLNLKEGDTLKIQTSTKFKLLDIYDSDISNLESLINVNLDCWKPNFLPE